MIVASESGSGVLTLAKAASELLSLTISRVSIAKTRFIESSTSSSSFASCFAEAKSTFAPECSRTCLASLPVKSGSTGTATRPKAVAAKKATDQFGCPVE